jgi:hypothetical protein
MRHFQFPAPLSWTFYNNIYFQSLYLCLRRCWRRHSTLLMSQLRLVMVTINWKDICSGRFWIYKLIEFEGKMIKEADKWVEIPIEILTRLERYLFSLYSFHLIPNDRSGGLLNFVVAALFHGWVFLNKQK